MSAQDKTLYTQAQQFMLNLLQYFKREKENGGPLILVSTVEDHVASALGISEKTVRNIKSRAAATPVLTSPGRKRPR
ncbi:hypothetical protein FQA39_LY08718 [Lamprigera yunnana]|nr:hypothetical protein FQA39_LY08718 [Lamprigera yunnana]